MLFLNPASRWWWRRCRRWLPLPSTMRQRSSPLTLSIEPGCADVSRVDAYRRLIGVAAAPHVGTFNTHTHNKTHIHTYIQAPCHAIIFPCVHDHEKEIDLNNWYRLAGTGFRWVSGVVAAGEPMERFRWHDIDKRLHASECYAGKQINSGPAGSLPLFSVFQSTEMRGAKSCASSIGELVRRI